MEDVVISGILNGYRTYHGVTFVVLSRGEGEVLLSPNDFPSESWINEHLGKTAIVVLHGDKVASIKEGVHPHKVMDVEIIDDRVAIKCVACDEIACYAPKPGTTLLAQARDAMRPFMDHIKAKHPALMDEIMKSLPSGD